MMQIAIEDHKESTKMLESIGLSNYEARAYISLLTLGQTDARTICDASEIPSSKIYGIMEKFELLGLTEVQHSKPTRYKVIPPSIGLRRLVSNKEKEIIKLKDELPAMEGQLSSLYSMDTDDDKTFSTLEFGLKNFIQKHVPKMTESHNEICGTIGEVCLKGLKIYGSDVRQKVPYHLAKNDVYVRWILPANRSLLKFFLNIYTPSDNLQIRVMKPINSIFHVIDNKSVVSVIDSTVLDEGRLASIYTNDKKLVNNLKEYFKELWSNADDYKKFLS